MHYDTTPRGITTILQLSLLVAAKHSYFNVLKAKAVCRSMLWARSRQQRYKKEFQNQTLGRKMKTKSDRNAR